MSCPWKIWERLWPGHVFFFGILLVQLRRRTTRVKDMLASSRWSLLFVLLVSCTRWATAQFFQFQQGGINLEDLMGGGGFGGFGGGGGEELPQQEEEEEEVRWPPRSHRAAIARLAQPSTCAPTRSRPSRVGRLV